MRSPNVRFAVSPRLLTAVAAALTVLLAWAPPALADAQTSSNWGGYAVHGRGLHFRQVSGQWRVPRVDCSAGRDTYSAMWVGIGGFSTTSNALEQTGIEADCSGLQPVYSAWYELVPAASQSISLAVHPGDLMRAVVVVRGRQVTLQLSDLTRHRSFSRTLTASIVDTTSAEWILEAPGDCAGARCVTLPLSDFRSATFSLARVITTTGRAGPITGAHWHTTRITLTVTDRHFLDGGAPTFIGGADPGRLTAAGSAFRLTYATSSSPQAGVRAAAAAGGRLVH